MKRQKQLEDFDCGHDFFARVQLLRDAKELEWIITHRLSYIVEFLEFLHGDDDPLDAGDWDHVRYVLARAGLSDPECWPSWCFPPIGRVGDSDGMEQARLFGDAA